MHWSPAGESEQAPLVFIHTLGLIMGQAAIFPQRISSAIELGQLGLLVN